MPEETQTLSPGKRVLVFVVIFGLTFGTAYGAWIAFRTVGLYRQTKSAGRGWSTPVNVVDPVLGYRPLPRANTMEMFPCGIRVPVFEDANGFRVEAQGLNAAEGGRPFVLSLGCSFAFGTGCAAEQTYTCLAAKGLHGTPLNGGVGGYGLAQMLLRARELVPTLKPEYLLVEYAPWLLSRSIDYTSTWEAHGRTPRPYFAIGKDGKWFVAPPAFSTNYFDLGMSDYVDTRSSAGDFASFLLRVGAPLWTYSDIQLCGLSCKRMLRMLPEPAQGSIDLVKEVYVEISGICQENGTRMVIVLLGSGGIPPSEMKQGHVQALQSVSGAVCVDAYATLYARLDSPTPEAYEKAYGIWGCSPEHLVDRHPNPLAHQVIAEAIVQALQREAKPQ